MYLGHPKRQIGLARGQGFQRAREGFVAEFDAGGWLQRQKVRAQLHHGGFGDDAVNSNGQLRLPAGCHALDPVGDRIQVFEQPAALAQQFGAGFGQLGLARTAVIQQHVQRLLNLAHPVAQGAGHHAQSTSGGGKTAGTGDGLQHGQGIWRERVSGVSDVLHLILLIIQIV